MWGGLKVMRVVPEKHIINFFGLMHIIIVLNKLGVWNFRRLEWKNFEVTVSDKKTIHVRNVSNDAKDKLDFRDRIIKACLDFNHLVVCTTSQCYVYT